MEIRLSKVMKIGLTQLESVWEFLAIVCLTANLLARRISMNLRLQSIQVLKVLI